MYQNFIKSQTNNVHKSIILRQSKPIKIRIKLFYYIYATKITLCSFPKVETPVVGLLFLLPF
jgi:hypothetical protein